MEIEAKVKVEDLEQVKQKLIQMGAQFSEKKKQIDHIFKPKGKEFAEQGPGDYIWRIRESARNKLTFKALTETAGVWVEHETEIKDPEEMKKILLKSGFSQVLIMTKERTPGELGDFELCLDDIKELGTHLEIALDSNDEKIAKKRIVELLGKLGYGESQIIHKGYVAILFERMGVKFRDGTG
jgi:predicted adenylyl cyclase CyaB